MFFTEHVQWENEQNRLKMNDNFEKKTEINVLLNDWTKNKMCLSRTINERNEKNETTHPLKCRAGPEQTNKDISTVFA